MLTDEQHAEWKQRIRFLRLALGGAEQRYNLLGMLTTLEQIENEVTALQQLINRFIAEDKKER